MIYLIGSLRNANVPTIAATMRASGIEVFDDWYAAGPEADDKWREYEQGRGHTYCEALHGFAARNVFQFDHTHLDRCEAALLVLPAGKSGHLELGYVVGSGRPGYILLDTPDRWDVMYQFATLVTTDLQEIITHVNAHILAPNTRPTEPPSGIPHNNSDIFNPLTIPIVWGQVGSEVPGVGGINRVVEQGPFDANWSCHCGAKSWCGKCGVQRIPAGHAR